MKSFEAKISKALKPSKNIETEKVKRKALATDDSGTCGDSVTYAFKADTGTLTISGNGVMASYSEYNNAPWYSYRSSIKNVVIEDSVTSIGDSAFMNCDSFTSISIPDIVTSIGDQAFYGCSGLTSITIPDSVTSIGYAVFSWCSDLASITIPDSVTEMGAYAFSRCSGLTSVTIGNSVKSIEDSAFYNCYGLTSIIIPDSVTSIGSSAFAYCSGLTSVTIGNSVKSIKDSAFYNCYGLTSVIYTGTTGPATGNSVFGGYNKLKEVTVPLEYTESTFCHMSVNKVSFSGSCGDSLEYSFDSNSGDLAISGSGNMSDFSPEGAPWYSYRGAIKSLSLGNEVTSIGSHAFDGFNSLTSVSIPDSVTEIEEQAFSNCEKLASFSVAEGNPKYTALDDILYTKRLTDLQKLNSFVLLQQDKNLDSLVRYPAGKTTTSFTIDDVASIKNYAFQGCNNLETIIIGASVKSIGNFAFSGCSSLTTATYNGISDPGYNTAGVFSDCDRLPSVNVPQNYEGNTFCGLPVNKMSDPDSSSEGGSSDSTGDDTPTGGGSSDNTGDGDTPAGGESSDTTSEDDASIVDSTSDEGDNDPVNLGETSNKGSSKTGIIAGSVAAAVAVVAAVAVTTVMYVKKLACFGRAAASVSEGGAPAEEV